MKENIVTAVRFLIIIISILTLVAACGKSTGSDSPVATTTVSGIIFAAPVSGASVMVKDSSGTAIAGPVNSASDGTYSVDIPATALASDLRIESGSGTFTDEATGQNTPAGTLAAYVSGGSLTSGATVNIDPSSTIIHALVTRGGRTFGEAKTLFNALFGYTPDTSVAPKNGPSTGSDDAERLAGLRAGAFSQLTRDLGLEPDKQSALLAAIAMDLGDGDLNGRNGPEPITIGTIAAPEDMGNRFERALVSFLSNTVSNLTGLGPDKIGSLPFAKVVLTNTYRVEYLPGMMAASQGKTMFRIRITDSNSGTARPGLSISLMPVMHMPSMSHSSPVDNTITDNGDGTYSGTVYYLMASGPGMGYWELKVMIGSGMTGETAIFHPCVGMAMGSGTVRAMLKGQGDIISSMTGTEKRSYYLFNDGLASGATTTFKLFIAAKQDMMSYPGVSPGTVLSSPTNTITSMTVQASTDSSFSAPVSAVDNGGGHWTVSGLPGLASGQTGTIYVKLNINGEDKTTDGNAPSGANASAVFTIAAGM